MLSNRKTSRFYSVKGIGLLALALALLMNVTAFASENSRFAFIDTAAEFFGLQTASAVETASSEQGITITSSSIMMAPCTANPAGVPIPVSIPSVTASGATVSVPILIGDTTDCNITGVDLQVTFDPTIISMAPGCTTACFSQGGTVSAPLTVIPNTNNAGHFIAAIFGINPIAGSGTFLILNFNVVGTQGQTSAVTIEDYTSPVPQFHRGFAINSDDPLLDAIASPITNGSVSIPAFTPTNTATNTATDTPTPSATNTFTPTGTFTATATFTPTPLCAQVDIDDETVTTGSAVQLSVTTTTLTTALNALSLDTHITFDPAKLALNIAPNPSTLGITLGTVGSSNSPILTVNQPTPGLLTVSISGTTPFVGSGSLFDIHFTALGSPGDFTPVFFTPWTNPPFGSSDPDGFKYNEGFPTSCLTNGSVTISGTAVGLITYKNSETFGPRHVPGTTITASGAPVVTGTSNSTGNYFLSGFGSGSYSIAPSRSDASAPNTKGTSINAFDAARVIQRTLNIGAPFNATQEIVGNVTLADDITSLDASAIAIWAVSTAFDPNYHFTGRWFFDPASISHVFVGTVTDNFDAYLMGDVTGNWCDPVEYGPGQCTALGTVVGGFRPGPQKATEITAAKLTAPAGGNVVVPVNITGAGDKGIIAYQFDLRYDPKVIQPQADAVSVANTVSSGLRVVTNSATPGLLRVAVYGAFPIGDAGVLLNLRFTAVGGAYATSPLTLDRFMLNEGGISMNVNGGEVALTNPAESD